MVDIELFSTIYLLLYKFFWCICYSLVPLPSTHVHCSALVSLPNLWLVF